MCNELFLKKNVIMLLNESTRDKMLQPYVELLQSKGINTNLGLLKTELLKLLSDRAGIHNLSLQSNFYLAGAARYYFNGDLTVDRNVGLLSGQPDHFNEEICNRLNALIVILRNAYIDSVGTQFEQPEDFGTLSLAALLKKYNNKINTELGIVSPNKEKKEIPDNLDRTPNVGANYTFDIIYNYAQGTKYERPTSPGSWCVTYGPHHFNSYTKNSQPSSHLVVFRMDGWENIDRKNGKDENCWVTDNYGISRNPRPHDPYANSLIAFFQSNESWEPANWHGAPLITSRWNHGAHDSKPLEADRAYSLEEFMKITGVSVNDLKRIYEIWNKDKNKINPPAKKDTLSPEEKTRRINLLRTLKYAQMRVNGGEDFRNILQNLEVVSAIVGNGEKFSKGVTACKIENDYFLIDKNQIVFDTIVYNSTFNPFITKLEQFTLLANSVIINSGENVYMIYNYRMHKIMEVEGLNKFCSASIGYGYSVKKGTPPTALLFKQRGNRSVLFDSKTGIPIKLPNGHYIFEYCKYYGISYGITSNDSIITDSDIVFIMYDSSSRESYIYTPRTSIIQKFNNKNWEDITIIKNIYSPCNYFNVTNNDFGGINIEYQDNEFSPRKTLQFLFDKESGKQLNIFPNNMPYSKYPCMGKVGDWILLRYDSIGLRKLGIPRVNNKPFLLYNFKQKRFCLDKITHKPLQLGFYIRGVAYPNANLLIMKGGHISTGNAYLFDIDTQKEYPIPLPNKLLTSFDYQIADKDWFVCRVYGDMSISLNILSAYDYAYYGELDSHVLFVFFRFEDVINGQRTYSDELDFETMKRLLAQVDIIAEPNNADNSVTSVNESSINFTKEDIVDMTKKIYEILLENKKRGL